MVALWIGKGRALEEEGLEGAPRVHCVGAVVTTVFECAGLSLIVLFITPKEPKIDFDAA